MRDTFWPLLLNDRPGIAAEAFRSFRRFSRADAQGAYGLLHLSALHKAAGLYSIRRPFVYKTFRAIMNLKGSIPE